jgi:hypothetical protein
MTGGATAFSAGDANEVDITTAADVDDVADALRDAINLASIGVTAGVPVDGVIPLTSDISGPIEIEIIDTVADAGFTHEDITGGLAFAPTPGTTLIDFSECGTEADKVAAVTDAINAATTAEGLDLVAEDDGTIITATNTATGTMTMTFTGDLVDLATPVSAGLGGVVPVSGAVTVDMTGLTTATQGAAKICQVANALDASTLNVTCTSNSGVIAVTNGTNGTAGNVAITENVANAGFTVSGMTGGRNPLASATLDDVPDSDTRVAVTPAARTAAEALAAFAPTEQTFTIDYTDAIFKTGALSVTKTLFTLTAKQKLWLRSSRPQVAFAGTGITDVDVEIGTATSGNEGAYLPGVSLIQTAQHDSRGDIVSCHDLAIADTDLDVVATFTATGANFGNGSATVLTAGKVWITISTVTLPDGS